MSKHTPLLQHMQVWIVVVVVVVVVAALKHTITLNNKIEFIFGLELDRLYRHVYHQKDVGRRNSREKENSK